MQSHRDKKYSHSSALKVNCLPLIILYIDFLSLYIIDIHSLYSFFSLWPMSTLCLHTVVALLCLSYHESVTHTLVRHVLSPAFSAFSSPWVCFLIPWNGSSIFQLPPFVVFFHHSLHYSLNFIFFLLLFSLALLAAPTRSPEMEIV